MMKASKEKEQRENNKPLLQNEDANDVNKKVEEVKLQSDTTKKVIKNPKGGYSIIDPVKKDTSNVLANPNPN